MMLRALLLAGLGLSLAACKPDPADIELALGARGVPADQAECIGEGLQVLSEDDWRTLAEVGRDFLQSEEQLRGMTLGEVEARLRKVEDPRLFGTLLRTGVGCVVMHGGFAALPPAREPGPELQEAPETYPPELQ